MKQTESNRLSITVYVVKLGAVSLVTIVLLYKLFQYRGELIDCFLHVPVYNSLYILFYCNIMIPATIE
jgi:hypothetical protein